MLETNNDEEIPTKSISMVSAVFLRKNYSHRESIVYDEDDKTQSDLPSSASNSSEENETGTQSLNTRSIDEERTESSSESEEIDLTEVSVKSLSSTFIGLRYAENLGIVSVFEDTIDELEILRHLLPHSFDKYDGYMTLEERYGEEGVRTQIFPEEGLNEIDNCLMKVQRDRAFAESVIVRTVLELQKSNVYEALEEAIENQQQMEEDAAFLLDDVEKHEEEVVQLRAGVKEVEALRRRTIDETEGADGHLKDMTHAKMVQVSIKTRYLTRWEKARMEQKHYDAITEEKKLRDRIANIFTDIDNEYRANQEIETYINMNKQELEDSIERWMELYDKEVEERDQAIIQLKMEREVQMRNFVELQATFESHRVEMNAWLVKKEERRVRAEREAFLNKMATRIQAWWRGTMYRRKLGPYRKKKKKGGNQKGKPAKKKR